MLDADTDDCEVVIEPKTGITIQAIHPSLPGPIKFGIRRPGHIDPASAASYNFANNTFGSAIFHELVGMLVDDLGLEKRHAESIVEGWDACSMHKKPWFEIKDLTVG